MPHQRDVSRDARRLEGRRLGLSFFVEISVDRRAVGRVNIDRGFVAVQATDRALVVGRLVDAPTAR
jgi:hypothetical protein